MNKEAILQAVKDKLVSVQKHPNADLFIYNYTPRVQYDRLWTETTRMTRGLILDGDMNIVARPFPKFFNIEEHSEGDMPALSFDVFDKLDGSLGILYWLNDRPFIATRGSFTSGQSVVANEILYSKYSHLFDKLDRGSTYLFEIIYPENRIVVDYGDIRDLFLLTIIHKETGEERIEDVGFPVVSRFDGVNDWRKLTGMQDFKNEGFVIRFSNGFRVKMKFPEYVRLHRIVTGVSNITVWEYLSNDLAMDELLDRVPDEFYDWVKSVGRGLNEKYEEIKVKCLSEYKEYPTRKETALYFQTCKYPSVLFALLDGKNIGPIIWKMIRPKYAKPYTVSE